MSDAFPIIVFAGDDYYPSGGWKDFIGTYRNEEEARKAVANLRYDWWQIVDTRKQLGQGAIVDASLGQ